MLHNIVPTAADSSTNSLMASPSDGRPSGLDRQLRENIRRLVHVLHPHDGDRCPDRCHPAIIASVYDVGYVRLFEVDTVPAAFRDRPIRRRGVVIVDLNIEQNGFCPPSLTPRYCRRYQPARQYCRYWNHRQAEVRIAKFIVQSTRIVLIYEENLRASSQRSGVVFVGDRQGELMRQPNSCRSAQNYRDYYATLLSLASPDSSTSSVAGSSSIADSSTSVAGSSST